MDRRNLVIGFTALLGAAASAGPLNPPAGPIAPTPGPEPRIAINSTNTPGDADSVFRIGQAGSYYLTDNMLIGPGDRGIEIAASSVTIDLNGFQIAGFGGLQGIVASTTAIERITIRNGFIVTCSGGGVDLASIPGVIVEGVNVEGSFGTGADGIAVGANSTVRGCIVKSNQGNGILVGTNSTISGCTAADNSLSGINADGGCTITDCSAADNSLLGIDASLYATITNCSASNNALTGIDARSGSVITSCTASNNIGSGIVTEAQCVITNCTASSNDINGITTDLRSTITNCTASVNSGNGIETDAGCVITTCTASSNGGHGISTVGSGCIVTGCVALFNILDGIRVTSFCRVADNTCQSNGNGASVGAGIRATSFNRVEGNHCAANDTGIDVGGADNIIIRNTCSTNTVNWDIAAGNKCLVVLGVDAGAILGDSGGASPGSTNPNANFTH